MSQERMSTARPVVDEKLIGTINGASQRELTKWFTFLTLGTANCAVGMRDADLSLAFIDEADVECRTVGLIRGHGCEGEHAASPQ